MLKRIMVLVLVVALFFTFSSVAFAIDETEIERFPSTVSGAKFTYINYVTADLTINSTGLASCTAEISAYNSVDSVRVSAYLQKYDGGWQTVKHWGQNYSGTYGAMAKSWYVTKGYRYRWHVYYYAYSGSDSESTTRTVYRNYY